MKILRVTTTPARKLEAEVSWAIAATVMGILCLCLLTVVIAQSNYSYDDIAGDVCGEVNPQCRYEVKAFLESKTSQGN